VSFVLLGNVSKQTILDLAPVSVLTEGHLGEVVLVQEFAYRALHAEVVEPVAADHGVKARIVLMLGGSYDEIRKSE
jgi:hypothetical protein